jgi:hypothetical protein
MDVLNMLGFVGVGCSGWVQNIILPTSIKVGGKIKIISTSVAFCLRDDGSKLRSISSLWSTLIERDA